MSLKLKQRSKKAVMECLPVLFRPISWMIWQNGYQKLNKRSIFLLIRSQAAEMFSTAFYFCLPRSRAASKEIILKSFAQLGFLADFLYDRKGKND
ncbi:hypothetical protein MOB89_16060 [Bacillus inaquosorum]|uniref:hypothetical protein n=1 Tax=Bacillus inaquosorum TaxID=483913 RepID=UPI0022814F74|nr:hypothetical protein [Bacillus inaquosorum]MCY7984910.1 hypothetical protein [Bacillus inaquosorum]